MNIFILTAFMFAGTSLVFAASGNKQYSEEEFIKKVNEEVQKKVDSIKKKSVSELTKEILDKEEKLQLRELDLQKRTDALKVSESDLAKKYSEFEARQKAFIGCVEKNEEDGRARIGQLVDMVSNMKPQKAAEVLSVQDSEIAVKILQMIDAKKASKIFNFMDKEISAKLQKQYLLMKK
jgi:flagellar motility protein MotE (MotC chaperone)